MKERPDESRTISFVLRSAAKRAPRRTLWLPVVVLGVAFGLLQCSVGNTATGHEAGTEASVAVKPSGDDALR